MIVGLPAVLSASAAAGMRITLPLLILGLFQSDRLWSNVPLLAFVHPKVVHNTVINWVK